MPGLSGVHVACICCRMWFVYGVYVVCVWCVFDLSDVYVMCVRFVYCLYVLCIRFVCVV